jgi:MFS family permease
MISPRAPTVANAIEPRRRARGRAAGALAIWAVSVVFAVISLLTLPSGASGAIVAASTALVALSFVSAGAILVSRLPTNPIGWLLLAGGLCFALGNGATGLGVAGLSLHPGSVPGAVWFAWLSEWIWAPAVGSVIGLALVYPSGKLLSPRWRPVALGAFLLIAILSVGTAFGPWTDGLFPVQNPLAINGGTLPPQLRSLSFLGTLLGLLTLAVPLLSVGSLVVRYRRSVGVERAQLKWFAAVVALSVPAFLISTFLYTATGLAGVVAYVAGGVAYFGFALLPVAIGIAVLRYRLYEIDRLISRTISYGVLSAIVTGLFVGFILVFQAVLAPVTQSNELAVAASTLLAATLFQPIRRRVQRLVDRRFNRSRYHAERTVAAFAGRLRDEVDLDGLRAEILATVSASVQPSPVSLWLRD